MIIMRNAEIRAKIVSSGLFYWQIAEAMGIRQDKLSTILRYSLTEEMKAKILKAIEDAKVTYRRAGKVENI
jgi:hypothetical protein